MLAVRVKDGVFIGNTGAAREEGFLVLNKITRVINCASGDEDQEENEEDDEKDEDDEEEIGIPKRRAGGSAPLSASHGHQKVSNIRYKNGAKHLSFSWSRDQNNTFDCSDVVVTKISDFIEEALVKGECALIFSTEGISRCCAVVSAYLMKKFHWTLQHTLDFISVSHPDMAIRPNLMRNLKSFSRRRGMEKDIFSPQVDTTYFPLDNEQWVLKNTFFNSLAYQAPQNSMLRQAVQNASSQSLGKSRRQKSRVHFSDSDSTRSSRSNMISGRNRKHSPILSTVPSPNHHPLVTNFEEIPVQVLSRVALDHLYPARSEISKTARNNLAHNGFHSPRSPVATMSNETNLAIACSTVPIMATVNNTQKRQNSPRASQFSVPPSPIVASPRVSPQRPRQSFVLNANDHESHTNYAIDFEINKSLLVSPRRQQELLRMQKQQLEAEQAEQQLRTVELEKQLQRLHLHQKHAQIGFEKKSDSLSSSFDGSSKVSPRMHALPNTASYQKTDSIRSQVIDVELLSSSASSFLQANNKVPDDISAIQHSFDAAPVSQLFSSSINNSGFVGAEETNSDSFFAVSPEFLEQQRRDPPPRPRPSPQPSTFISPSFASSPSISSASLIHKKLNQFPKNSAIFQALEEPKHVNVHQIRSSYKAEINQSEHEAPLQEKLVNGTPKSNAAETSTRSIGNSKNANLVNPNYMRPLDRQSTGHTRGSHLSPNNFSRGLSPAPRPRYSPRQDSSSSSSSSSSVFSSPGFQFDGERRSSSVRSSRSPFRRVSGGSTPTPSPDSARNSSSSVVSSKRWAQPTSSSRQRMMKD